MSRKPREAIKPTFAPFSSRIAFVTTVVACANKFTLSTCISNLLSACSKAISTACPKLPGVDETFVTPMVPSFSFTTATSVNVPPISTPIRQLILTPKKYVRLII